MRFSGGNMKTTYEITPFSDKNNVPIILACDNKYVPFTSVLLTSLYENANKDNNYDVLLFQKDISDANKVILNSCISGKKNISLRFIDVSAQIKNLNLRVFSYYSEAIYYRLFAPWLLNLYDKILYFDCDLVFNDDVAKMYNVDMGDMLLGAVRDHGMLLHKNNPYDNFPDDYYSVFLENIDINNYFNSGVLIMNLKQFRHDFDKEYILSYVEKKQWRFPDQDVLNVVCANRTIILDSKWNTMPETLGGRTVENIRKFIAPELCDDYVAARDNPSVIHYAMREKPWKYSVNLDWTLGKYFWRYAFLSPAKILVLREKYKTCSFAEIYELIEQFDPGKVDYRVEEGNIVAYYNYYKLFELFREPILFDLVSWDEKNLTLHGRYVLTDVEKDLDPTVTFRSDGREFAVNVNNIKPAKTFGEKVISCEYHFTIDIPFDSVDKKSAYNLVFAVNGMEISNGRFDFGKFFPVDRLLSKQYFVHNKIVMQADKDSIVFTPLSKFNVAKQEWLYLNQIRHLFKDSYKKIFLKRFLYKLVKKLYRKEIWIISDRTQAAGDNGEALFEYINGTKNREIKAYFAISKYASDYNRMKKIGHTLALESNYFKFVRLICDKMISSHCEGAICYPFRQPMADLLVNQKVVFLQHGITKDDISSIYNKKDKNLSLFVTASMKEYDSIVNNKNYFLTDKEVVLTGFPRFDKLTHAERNVIAVLPTWRKGYLKKVTDMDWELNCDFSDTAYYKYYSAFLYDKKLHDYLKAKGYVIKFVQHPLMPTKECFQDTDVVKIVEDANYPEIFSESKILVTDYSSTAFDFAYLRKPVIYYQFDKEEFFASHTYTEGYFEYLLDGFGTVTSDASDAVDEVINLVEKGCKIDEKYQIRIDDFFAYSDRNNSKRVFDAIKNLR